MKKFLTVLGVLVSAVLICALVYLAGVVRPDQVEQQRIAAEIAEQERLAELERIAAEIEANRDHREYSIFTDATGNELVDTAVESKIEKRQKEFMDATSKQETDRFLAMTRYTRNDGYYSVVLVTKYLDVENIDTFFVDDNGKIKSNKDLFGENWRAYLADYFQYNIKKMDGIREDLTDDYEEYIADKKGNFERFIMNKDGTATVYFDASTITNSENTLMITTPDNIMNGEYFSRRKVDPNKPMVAITFDDGPSEDFSPRIIDCLEQNNAVATFFEIGRNVDKFPEITRRAAEIGCEIGSHTYNHINLPSAYKSTLDNDKAACDDAFMKSIGYIPYLLRPPEGAIGGSAKFYYDNVYIGWSVDTLDWLNRNTGATISNVTNAGDLNKQVILMHSLYQNSAEAAEYLIPWLIDQGYQLVTISELLEFGYGIDVPEPHVYYAVDFFLYGRTPY